MIINSKLIGRIVVKNNVTIINSIIKGKILIKDNVTIKDSIIISNGLGIIESNTEIINKEFVFNNKIDNRITKTEQLDNFNFYNINILANNNYCKINCTILTYQEIYDALIGKNNLMNKLFKRESIGENVLKQETIVKWLNNKFNYVIDKYNIKIKEEV